MWRRQFAGIFKRIWSVCGMSERRAAVIDEGRILCAYCGSGDLAYAEDVSNEHRILRVEAQTIVYSVSAETDELGFNDRIVCNECGESLELPEGYSAEVWSDGA
jgi:hypothetical protein